MYIPLLWRTIELLRYSSERDFFSAATPIHQQIQFIILINFKFNNFNYLQNNLKTTVAKPTMHPQKFKLIKFHRR